MNSKTIESMSPHVLFILLSLGVKDRHGYEIMKQVNKESDGRITIGPGTLYGALKRLIVDRWVVEVGEKELAEKRNERRKYYHLTELGRKHLQTELVRYEETIEKAREMNIFGTGTVALSL
jgi:DNA-binding PadR family transcriptional regulator